MIHRQVGQNLAVEVDVRLLQAADELGVGHAVHAGSRVDTGDPKLTEVTLFKLAVLGRKAHCAIDGLGCDTEKFAAAATETFRQLKAATATFTGRRSIGNTHCLLSPFY